jgi:hypothetical protein
MELQLGRFYGNLVSRRGVIDDHLSAVRFGSPFYLPVSYPEINAWLSLLHGSIIVSFSVTGNVNMMLFIIMMSFLNTVIFKHCHV